MILRHLTVCFVLFSVSAAAEIYSGNDQLQTAGLIQDVYNAFNNLSNVALMPNLMESADCRRDCEIYRQALFQNHLWAAQIFDANGRQSFGILTGYMHQFGNIKQCVSSSSKELNIEGKFCFLKIYLKAVGDDNFINKVSKNSVYTTLWDSNPYERSEFPFNAILSGSCIPASCTARDLMIASRKALSALNETRFGLQAHVDDLDEEGCAIRREYFADDISIVYYAKIFIMGMSVLVICATIIDVLLLQNVQTCRHPMLTFTKSLSLRQNLKAFTSVANDDDFLGCLNGLRCLTHYILFLAHTSLKFGIGMVDRSDVGQVFTCPFLASLMKSGTTSLDLIDILSGISHSYKITKISMRNDIRSIFKSIVYKYLRFLAFMLTFFFFRTSKFNKNKLTMLFSDTQNKSSIWSIILCYENLYGYENMFFAPSHTIYTDMQLYFICCVVLILTRNFNHKTKLYFSIAFGSLLCRSLYLYFNPDTPGLWIFQFDMKKPLKQQSFLYGSPFSRMPLYFSGIALGEYIRRNPKHNPDKIISSFCAKIGWIAASLCFCIVVFSYYPTSFRNYQYSSFDGAIVTFIHTVCLSAFIAWTVWYCEVFKKGSSVYRFLAADQFVVLNRMISYFGPLHLFIVFRAAFSSSGIFEAKMSELLGTDYLLFTILLCTYIFLFVHLPLKNIWRCIFGEKSSSLNNFANGITEDVKRTKNKSE